jgi:hypothetical protein
MAREAGILDEFDTAQDIIECGIEVWLSGERGIQTLERFAALVRADEREIVMNEPLTKENWQRFEDEIRADEQEKYKWDIHSCGPTCKRYACVAMREAVEAEREALLDLVDDYAKNNTDLKAAIRARGNT